MKGSLLVLAASIAAAVSTNAFAATTGTVNFQGSVINTTCQIAAGSENQTITLPQVPSDTFTAANQVAGSPVPFQITLNGCDASTPGNVAVAFDFVTSGPLDNVIENAGTATGVGLQLRDAQNQVITMDSVSYYTTPVALASGDLAFNLNVDYVSTSATVTAGSVLATATIGVHYP